MDRFREHFRGLQDRYVLLGGAACDIALDAAGLEFRAECPSIRQSSPPRSR